MEKIKEVKIDPKSSREIQCVSIIIKANIFFASADISNFIAKAKRISVGDEKGAFNCVCER